MLCTSNWSLPTLGVSLKKIPGVLLTPILFQQMKLKHQNQRQEYQKGLEVEQVFFLGIDWMDELLIFLLQVVRLQISGQRDPQNPQFFPLEKTTEFTLLTRRTL